MFEALVERLLNQILGEYVEDFSTDNLHIGIWSGEVTLKNIKLKKEIMKKLNLPFILRFSRLGCLKMNIPWKSLTSSKIEVLLEGLQIVIAELPHAKWECKNTKIIETRKKEIQEYCQSVLADFVKKGQKSKQENEGGYFSQLVVKILDNLQVTIKDIHIRYQDQLTQTYSFGVTLEELRVYTVNSQDQPEYIDRTKLKYENQPLRKRLELYNLGVYWNEKSEMYNQTNYFQKLNGSIARRGSNKQQQNYIILLSSQAKLLQRQAGKQFLQPQLDLAINLESIKIQITNNQLQQIINLAERLQKYKNEVKAKNTQQLSLQEKRRALEDFAKIFPEYYRSWGKDLPSNQLNRLEEILEKMETENFTKIMSKHLQQKEKERLINQKKQKSKGWFGWSKPKEISSAEMLQIENYLNDNFAKEVAVVKRPENYYYFNLQFRMQKLQLVIANTLAIIKEGIISEYSQLFIDFRLRQGGYKLNLGLHDISVKLFKQVGVEPMELTNILYKVLPIQGTTNQKQYVKMQVVGNPIDKKHLNTDIKLVTSQLMFVFYPKIISVATEFADLKLSKENKEAAVQKYGQLKEITTSAVNQSLEQSKKQSIGADIFINAITIGIPFDPRRPNGQCWGLTLGNTHFTTDEQTLKRTEISQNLPMDVYKMNLKLFSFRQYENIQQLQDLRQKVVKQIDPRFAVIDQLDFDLNVQIYSKATHSVPKIKISAILPDLSVNLNHRLYKNLLKIGECFQEQKKSDFDRATIRYVQKSQIKEKASKIGMVYIKDGVTQIWRKYVAIMSENYIYIYLNTKDQNYYAYYYIKNATLQRTYEPNDKEKPYYFKIKNKLNEVTFGFDKPETIDDWMNKINNLSNKQQSLSSTSGDSQEEKKKIVSKKDPNALNLVVFAAIQKAKIKVNTSELQEDLAWFSLSGLQALVNLYQAKKCISLVLSSISIQDTIYKYKKPELAYFLKTQNDELTQSLIKIDINQLAKDHPDFDHVDSKIDVVFGSLICNYKCQTVKALMNFFIPPKQQQILIEEVRRDQEKSLTQAVVHRPEDEQQSFSLKLNLKIRSVAILLINEKVKTQVGKLGIIELNLYTGISQKRLCLKGSLKQLYLIDYSRYPYTILEQQQDYESAARYLMKANIQAEKNMLQFDIQILNAVNQNNKKMLIDLELNNLTLYYTQQPILRLITYLNTQMLPSFETGPKKVKEVQQNDDRPEPSQMELKVNLTNLSIFIQPNPMQLTKKEYLQLGIDSVTVKNNAFFRNYIKSEQKSILVQNYTVHLLGMYIKTLYYDQQGQKHQYQLTNKLKFTCSTDLIANPLYYQKTYGDEFLNGLRVECGMTPFFMALSQKDYNFIMKCLNWSITHDDGAQNVLFDIVQQNKVEDVAKPQQKAPFYLKVRIECLSLFVINKNVPVGFLLLDQLHLDFSQQQDQMNIDLCLENIYGTAMQFKDQNFGFFTKKVLNQRGMFNALGYQKTHEINENNTIADLIKLFDRRDKVTKKQGTNPFMKFMMATRSQQSTISIEIDELIIDIDVKILMVLSTIANTDQTYIKGPQPIKQKEVDILQQIFPKLARDIQQRNNMMMQKKRSSLTVIISRLVSSVSDAYKQKFIVLEGNVSFSMINEGQRNEEQLAFFFGNSQDDRLNHSQMLIKLKDLTLYFCKIKEGVIKSKRQILKPVNITSEIKKYYKKKGKLFVLNNETQVKVNKLIFFSSFIDLINIYNIIKDNVKALGESEDKKEPQKVVVDQKLQQVTKEAQKTIQNRTKLTGTIEPIQFQLVNDCNSNFMPVMRLIIQDLKPFMDQILIKSHISAVLMISLHFFNPRSSKWQPIIEPFQLNVDYLTLLTPEGQNVKFLIESKPPAPAIQIPAQNEGQRQVEKIEQADIQTNILRINVSTQMLSTLLAAKEMTMKYKKKLQNVNLAIVDFIMSQKPQRQSQQFEVQISPFIFQNITNETIFLQREQKQFQIDPFFKGPIKLDNDREIKFRLKGQSYVFGLDHFGTLRISFSSYFIQYDADKLNRVIRFIPSIMIQNKLLQSVYIRREGSTVSNVPRKVQIGQKIPLDNIESFAVSLNGNSYTQTIQVNDIYMINTLSAANKKFNILWDRKIFLNKYEVFQLLPPFIINNCIPKPMSLQFISKAKTINTKTIPSQSTHQVCASQNIGQMELKLSYPGYNWTKKFKYHPQHNGVEQSVVLEDEYNGLTHLNYIFEQTEYTNQIILTVYCKKLIINELQDKLIIYGNLAEDQRLKRSDNYRLLGGQRKNDDVDDKITLIGSEVGDKLRICGVNSMFDFATPVLIGGLGSSQSRIVVDRVIQGKNESVFTIIGVTISLMKMSNNCDIYCKKIVLTTKTIISNSTSRDLTIKQEFATRYSSFIPKGTRQCTLFGLPELKNKMHDGYILQTPGFEKSKVFTLPEQGSVFVKLQSQQINNQGERSSLYFLVRAKTVELYKFYEITEVSQDNFPYELITKSKNVQVKLANSKKIVGFGQSFKFMKQDDNERFEVQIEIKHELSKETLKVKVLPDDLNFKESRKMQAMGQVNLEIYIEISDKTKAIVVNEVQNVGEKRQIQKQYIQVNLPQIIVSISQNSQSISRPYQSLVITLQRLIFILDQTDRRTTYQFKLGFLQIDQAYPHTLSNPVILTPHKFQEFTRQEKPEWVFNSMMVINNSYKETTFINQISVDFNDIVVKFSLDFLNLVTEVSKEFTSILNYKDESNYLFLQIQKWKNMQIPKEGSKTFIKTIKITPFYIDLSAELNLKKLGLQNNQLLNTIMSAIGVVVSNIEDAPIRLSGMAITNCIDTAEGITNKIVSRYKGDVINQLYKIFGSLNIIGNPMGLLRSISTGFQDLKNKPAKGFVNGPAQFGKGIAQGAGSLVAHSVGGAFNSLSKITGTFSTGLATFAFDKDFEEHRQKEKMRKPQNVFQGLEKGGRAILHGFKAGISGVFTQPYQNARRQGALGFMKGAAKGLAGLVVKPVTGLIDFASKTTEGIKNNALVFEDKANDERMRYPRVFYTECFVMKEYNKIDSQIQSILMKPINQDKFKNVTFVDCFAAAEGVDYLVVLREYVVYLDVVKRKILWDLPVLQFQCDEIPERKLVVFKGRRRTSMFHSNNFDVKIENDQERSRIVGLINRIIKQKLENI